MTGLQAARRAVAPAPELRLLMLSMYDDEQYLYEALKAGASGYVLKSAADRDLVEACRAAMRGEPFLYPAAVTALIVRLPGPCSGRQGPGARAADAARARDPEADRRGLDERCDRPRAGHQPPHRGPPPREHARPSWACGTGSSSRATPSVAAWSSPESVIGIYRCGLTWGRAPIDDRRGCENLLGMARLIVLVQPAPPPRARRGRGLAARASSLRWRRRGDGAFRGAQPARRAPRGDGRRSGAG